MSDPKGDRRPIAARSSGWARRAAAALAARGVSPNAISLASIGFAATGAALLVFWPGAAGLVTAALCIEGRLICNLLDGMVAVEGGRGTKLGVIYNEFPDRIADSLLIVACGHAAGLPAWGWAGALLAALTAYVRVFGASLGLGQDFRGPMAKQHRMAVLAGACLGASGEAFLGATHYALGAATLVMVFGAGLTCVTRTRAIARKLDAS